MSRERVQPLFIQPESQLHAVPGEEPDEARNHVDPRVVPEKSRLTLDSAGMADDVLDSGGTPDEPPVRSDPESEVAAFQEFLDQVDPDDFKG